MYVCAAGGTLADVTEEAGVEANAQTLVAGPLGPLHLLQALADRVLLCRLDSLLGGHSGESLAQPPMIPDIHTVRLSMSSPSLLSLRCTTRQTRLQDNMC